MLNLPDELIIIESDTHGEYNDRFDCPLARALKRHGIVLGDNYLVCGWGAIEDSEINRIVAQYAWADGARFTCQTNTRTGPLIKTTIQQDEYINLSLK